MNECNDKGDRHGYWEDYWPNGKLWAKIHYINGEEVYYEVYFSDVIYTPKHFTYE